MKRIGYILLLLMILRSCEEEKPEISFRVKIDGFSMKDDPSAFLWFYSEKPGVEKGGMSTTRFKVGYQYFISILE